MGRIPRSQPPDDIAHRLDELQRERAAYAFLAENMHAFPGSALELSFTMMINDVDEQIAALLPTPSPPPPRGPSGQSSSATLPPPNPRITDRGFLM